MAPLSLPNSSTPLLLGPFLLSTKPSNIEWKKAKNGRGGRFWETRTQANAAAVCLRNLATLQDRCKNDLLSFRKSVIFARDIRTYNPPPSPSQLIHSTPHHTGPHQVSYVLSDRFTRSVKHRHFLTSLTLRTTLPPPLLPSCRLFALRQLYSFYAVEF